MIAGRRRHFEAWVSPYEEDRVLCIVREITERKKAEERIRESERRYRLLFEHANEAIVIFQDGQTKLFNEKTLELTGYTAQEYRGLTLDELIHPADLDMVRQRYRQRTAGTIADEPYEYRILTKSGTTKRMRMKPARILWEGRPASMGMIEDITELKETEAELQQALEEKDFLMRELNHRVKNNLYMISSLVNLKDEALGEQADLSDIRHQISAIEIVHDKLSSLEKVATVEIREYLTDLLERLFSTSSFPEVRLETDMEALTLPTKKAVPLGLITNEIATNAVKYGFRRGEEAVFSVSLHRDPGDGRFIYILANTGAPFPEEVNFEDPDSLGLRLIRTLVFQLDGTVELQKSPSPAFTIRFPAEEQ
jgi:PAS domain S-box-containing protein